MKSFDLLSILFTGYCISYVVASPLQDHVARDGRSSSDGTCGGRKGYTCLNSGYGNCCSQYGYCGSKSSYCGTGCNPAYGTCNSSPSPSVTPKSNSISTRTSSSATPLSTVKVSTNARCGQGFGFTCQGSQYGNCCSQYSYCGPSSAYCGTGCQSGFGTCQSPVRSSSSSSTPGTTSSSARTSSSSSISSSIVPSSSSLSVSASSPASSSSSSVSSPASSSASSSSSAAPSTAASSTVLSSSSASSSSSSASSSSSSTSFSVSSASATPTPATCTPGDFNGRLQILDATTKAVLGYVADTYNAFNVYTLTALTANALIVQVEVPPSRSCKQLPLYPLTGPNDFAYFGIVDAMNGPYGMNMAGSGFFTNVGLTSPGSPPQNVPNSDDNTATAEGYIWTYDPVTAYLTPQWINFDTSQPTTYSIYDQVNDYVGSTGDVNYHNSNNPTDLWVSVQLKLIPL